MFSFIVGLIIGVVAASVGWFLILKNNKKLFDTVFAKFLGK